MISDYETAALKQERDELAAQVEVMREVVEDASEIDEYFNDPPRCVLRLTMKSRSALSITPSAALREIQARTLEDMMSKFPYFSSEEGLWLADAIQAIAAAKRKGETT